MAGKAQKIEGSNRSINISGNVSGTNIVSGDNNFVGSGNTVNQRNMNVGGNFNNTGVLNLGEISGNVTNTINQLPASPDSTKPGLRELLTKLQDLIQNTAGLAEEDKAEALNHVKSLAEIGKNPNEKSKSKSILRWFKGFFSELPDVAETAKDMIESVTEIFA